MTALLTKSYMYGSISLIQIVQGGLMKRLISWCCNIVEDVEELIIAGVIATLLYVGVVHTGRVLYATAGALDSAVLAAGIHP